MKIPPLQPLTEEPRTGEHRARRLRGSCSIVQPTSGRSPPADPRVVRQCPSPRDPPKMLLDELDSQLFAREQKNKIWTEIQVCAPFTPRYLLDGYFSAALRAAPCITKWIIICSDHPADPSLRDIRCARYPSDDLSKHVLLVSKLRSLYLQDRTVLTSMSVLDARTEIVGDRAQNDKDPVPVIRHEDIIRDEPALNYLCTFL